MELLSNKSSTKTSSCKTKQKKSLFSPLTVSMLFSLYLLTACGGSNNGSTVTTDTTAPVITLNGDAIIEHNYGDVYSDLGASATDNVDTSVTVITTGGVTVDMINSYTITYTATDVAGNTSSIKRTVNVIDMTGPVITLNGDNTVVLGKGRVYKELGAIAFDNLDGEMTLNPPSGSVDYDNLGRYKLTYTATDTAGNITTLVRNVDVNPPKPFITTWKTDNQGSSGDNEITITTSNAVYDYNVDWGDGHTDENLTGDYTHTYDTASTYTITISGSFPQLYFYDFNFDNQKLLSIEQWGDGILLSLNRAFYGCSNLTGNANDSPNLRSVTDMKYMFSRSAFNQDISDWDVSLITDMSSMFRDNSMFNQNISAWDVSSVTNMSIMFGLASAFNQDIRAWDVSSVTKMNAMFSGASAFNQDISTWDVSSVTNMSSMFLRASVFNQDISAWDVSSVNNMSTIFSSAYAFNQDISAWDVSSVTDMNGMFRDTHVFNHDISNWNVSSVTNMSDMFFLARVFNQDISAWDVSSVTYMGRMFRIASAFNQDISIWNVSSVTDMTDMFNEAIAFNQDISTWNVSSVQNMNDMFYGVTLSIENYDALLNGWSNQLLNSDVNFGVGNSQYSPSSQAARDILTGTYNWTITDGGVTP